MPSAISLCAVVNSIMTAVVPMIAGTSGRTRIPYSGRAISRSVWGGSSSSMVVQSRLSSSKGKRSYQPRTVSRPKALIWATTSSGKRSRNRIFAVISSAICPSPMSKVPSAT